MKKKSKLFILSLLSLLALTSCEKIDVPKGTPKCIKNKIKEESKCLDKVYQYYYNNQTVYLFNSRCPDDFHVLYNEICVEICKPSGGSSGNGDGKCGDFYQIATNEKLIWSR